MAARATAGAMSDAARLSPTRGWWVIAHRWAGLSIALFLIIAAITGAVLPFEEPLTFATRPDAAYAAPPHPGAMPLDGVTIAERVERATGAKVFYTVLDVPRDHVARMFVSAPPGQPALAYDVVWADPYTGAVRLAYKWGGTRDGIVNLVPLLYSLHYGIIAGPWGEWAFGIAALVWTIDCFVGFYLTLPRRIAPRRTDRRGAANRAANPGWLARWRPAWRIRRARGYKLTFDLHRAGGLWLWPLLFVFAWSGVALSLPQVEQPMMRVFGAKARFVPRALPRPEPLPRLSRRDAVARAGPALAAIGAGRGFTLDRLAGVFYDEGSGLYRVNARTSLDASDDGGQSVLWLDGGSGAPVRFEPPQGETAADTFMAWLQYLHMARVFGLPYRIAVSVIGLLVTGLTVTGVLIWMRKRGAQLLSRRCPPHPAPARAPAAA